MPQIGMPRPGVHADRACGAVVVVGPRALVVGGYLVAPAQCQHVAVVVPCVRPGVVPVDLGRDGVARFHGDSVDIDVLVAVGAVGGGLHVPPVRVGLVAVGPVEVPGEVDCGGFTHPGIVPPAGVVPVAVCISGLRCRLGLLRYRVELDGSFEGIEGTEHRQAYRDDHQHC